MINYHQFWKIIMIGLYIQEATVKKISEGVSVVNCSQKIYFMDWSIYKTQKLMKLNLWVKDQVTSNFQYTNMEKQLREDRIK